MKNLSKNCTKAVELKPTYVKALLRRAELYEKTEKLDEALEDYQKLVELDPSLTVARQACMVSDMWSKCLKTIYGFYIKTVEGFCLTHHQVITNIH